MHYLSVSVAVSPVFTCARPPVYLWRPMFHLFSADSSGEVCYCVKGAEPAAMRNRKSPPPDQVTSSGGILIMETAKK